jgi:hypothetical protein
MAGLRPIGSEKLEGMDKIRRIMEIARYNENIPQSVNETKSSEYRINLADGNTYEIAKERQGYIIKKSINESEFDYIEPMKGRKYYPSYSQALKRLNLITKEVNTLFENEEGTPLIGEQKKKYVLKTKKPKAAAAPEAGGELPPAPDAGAALPPAPDAGAALPPAPDAGAELPPAPDAGAELPPAPDAGTELPPAPEEGGGELPPSPEEGGEMPPAPEGEEGEMPPAPEGEEELEIDVEKKPKEKKVSDLKRIQILVGKLAQKIRSYEEEKELSSQNVKYVINSILSALDVDVLDEDDIEEIISKLEGGDEDEEGGDEEMDMEAEVEGYEEEQEMVPPPPSPEGEEEIPSPEMAEEYGSYGDAFRDYLPAAYGNAAMRGMTGEQTEDDEDDYDVIDFEEIDEEDYASKGRRKRHFYPETDAFTHGTFGESSVDKVLSRYFTISEEEVKKQDLKSNKNYQLNKKNVIRLSETVDQMDSALEFISENPRVELIGLSEKKNLIFKKGINEVKITRTGNIL